MMTKNVRLFLQAAGWGARKVERMPDVDVVSQAEQAVEAMARQKGRPWSAARVDSEGRIIVKYGV